MATSPVLGIPLISSQQSQPEVTHNEAVLLLQVALMGAIQLGINTPPTASEGDVYVIGGSPTGAWSGQDNKIAIYFSGGWLFLPGVDDDGNDIAMSADQEGLAIYVNYEDVTYVWNGSSWIAAGGGGGSGLFGPLDPPTTAAFSSKIQTGTADGTIADVNGKGLSVQLTATGSNDDWMMAAKAASPPGSGTDVYEARLLATLTSSSFPSAALIFHDSGTNDFIIIGIDSGDLVPGMQFWNNNSFGSEIGDAQVPGQSDIFVRAEVDSAGEITAYWSRDGYSWLQLGSSSSVSAFDSVGFGVKQSSGDLQALMVPFYEESTL